MATANLIFHPVDKNWMKEHWRELSMLSDNEPWMNWREDQYLCDLPHKWEFSRTVYLGNELVGYMICSMFHGWLWLHRFVVVTEQRRKGFGRRCLKHLESLVAIRGLMGILVKTPKDNVAAINIYIGEGYTRLPRDDDHAIFIKKRPGGRFAVGIHQPNFIPWMGYFYKMSLCDCFVFLDDVLFPKGSFVNRNKINMNGHGKWLTVPLNRKLNTSIKDALINGDHWIVKHLRSLELNYGKSPFFKTYYSGIKDLIRSSSGADIATLNIKLLTQINRWLGIRCLLYRSSEIGSHGDGDERLISLVQNVCGDMYISGAGGAKYQSENTFQRAGIKLRYTDFVQVPYSQRTSEFVPNLSIVDALFNVGAEGIQRILSSIPKWQK
jgi:ribosomal protein S18 acetylase RimI-like enzyme